MPEALFSGGPLKVADGVVFRDLEGEAVLLNLDSGMYYGLDEVGTRVWLLIQEHGRVDAVVERMLDEFDVAPERLSADVTRLVSSLLDKGLLARVDDRASA
jgi:hypothetical protein